MKDEAAVIFKDGKYEEAIVKFEECMQLDELNANYNSTILLNELPKGSYFLHINGVSFMVLIKR